MKAKEEQSLPIEDFIKTLKERFEKHPQRHLNIIWEVVEARLHANPKALKTLLQMEQSGGEPDIIYPAAFSKGFIYMDCSAESPKQRRNLCYDLRAWENRKENKPDSNVLSEVERIGSNLLDEDQYRLLQSTGNYDLKTSSWLHTPEPVRKLGGAIFGDKRYDRLFIYHNGAESYYASRGFRTWIEI